ncbi:polysaccharide lyase family protein [Actinoplanes rectilineatus]|uniref:polysaccharide lyase family protein n=1 Tax=Actinoplanes rectilineatus TaxID=113571 RepID=UPI0009F85705|nr:polysaccharide lyase family protein [Actinoplanes rectilineatus]
MSRPVSRRTVLGLAGGVAGAAVLAPALATPATADAGSDVTLTDNGTTVTLANGIIEFTVVKATAELVKLRLIGSTQGNENIDLLPGGRSHGYTTFNIGTAPASGMKGATFSVTARTTDRIEISLLSDDATLLPFRLDIRFALERGASGLYSYWLAGYPDGMPDGLALGQLRYAFSTGADPSFRWFVVDDARGVQQRPSIADLQNAVTLQDSTVVLPDGRIWSKYQNSSDLEGDNNVFLMSNGTIGLSLVQASKESFGGPTRQELTVHDYYDGMILLWHPLTGHYGMPDVRPEKGWSKVYGPFYLHVGEAAVGDEAGNVAALWQDAKQVAAREVARWPYQWVTDPGYAATQRSAVSGRLAITGHPVVRDGWAVLYRPGPDRDWRGTVLDGTNWQYLGLDYHYFARIDPAGTFTIPAVRPGTYTLAAFAGGALGEYRRTGITVPAGTRVDTGRHSWKPVSHGTTLWQIGTPDRTAKEFHIPGGADGYRSTLAWLEYPYDFPDGVDFTVGVDDPAEKWNYFHPVLATPGTAAQLQWRGTTPDDTLTEWTIRFAARRYRAGTGHVDIAVAGAVFATLAVTLNGTRIANLDPLPGVPGDNSSYRQVARSMYRLLPTIAFPATLLRAGDNVLTLAPLRPGEITDGLDDWMEPMSGIMYDTIRLQVDHR